MHGMDRIVGGKEAAAIFFLFPEQRDPPPHHAKGVAASEASCSVLCTVWEGGGKGGALFPRGHASDHMSDGIRAFPPLHHVGHTNPLLLTPTTKEGKIGSRIRRA